MNRYQAYFVGSDGQFSHCRAFACGTDEHAIEWAKQLMDQRPVELWSGPRVVKRLSLPDDRQAITYEIREGRLVPKGAQ